MTNSGTYRRVCISASPLDAEEDENEKERALVNHVAYFRLAHGPKPSAKTIERLGLSVGMGKVPVGRIYKAAESLAERMRGTVAEKAARNGDVATASALMNKSHDEAEVKPNATPAPKKSGGSFIDGWLMVIVWPIIAVNAVCAFLLVCASNVLTAIAKTFKGELVK